MEISVVAVDLAKNVFQVHGYTRVGERVLAKRVNRAGFVRLLGELPVGCEVVMEACGSGHHWARSCQRLGLRVRLLPPQHVKAYVVGNKTDRHDAEAIYAASQRRELRAVPVKSVAEQDVLVAHRVRERRKKARVALMNQVRGLLAERGQVCGQGVTKLRAQVAATLAQGPCDEITASFLALLFELQAEWRALDEGMAAAEREIRRHARTTPACQQLQTMPGIGPITASAAVAMAGDGSAFRNGRQFAAWVGVTPKEHASGEKRRLGAITKRGDAYLRSLLVHGARAVVRTATQDDPFSHWVRALVERRGHNKAVVAVANKNARIVWALLRSGAAFRTAPVGV